MWRAGSCVELIKAAEMVELVSISWEMIHGQSIFLSNFWKLKHNKYWQLDVPALNCYFTFDLLKPTNNFYSMVLCR